MAAAVRVRLFDLLGQIDVEAAPVAERGERIAQSQFLRLGKVPAQLFDLRRGLLQVALKVGGIVLHLLVLGDQELDHRPHLVGLGEGMQVPVRLGERLGIAVVGVHVGAHEAQDDGQLAVELYLGRLQRLGAILELGWSGSGSPVAQRADGRDTEADHSKHESRGEDRLQRLSAAVDLRTLGRPQAECQNLKTHRAAPRIAAPHS